MELCECVWKSAGCGSVCILHCAVKISLCIEVLGRWSVGVEVCGVGSVDVGVGVCVGGVCVCVLKETSNMCILRSTS